MALTKEQLAQMEKLKDKKDKSLNDNKIVKK